MENEEFTEIPPGARGALQEWLAGRVGTLLHAWVVEEGEAVLALVATVEDEAFDEETDGYDVDSIELHMLTVFDNLQGSWEVSDDGDLKLGSLFGELANRFVNEDRQL